MKQEEFARHLPARRASVGQTALALLDQVPEVVDDRLLLPVAGQRTEEVQRQLDLETLLVTRRHGLPDRPAHHPDAREHWTDFHLQMEEVAHRPAVPDADVHLAVT